MRRKLSPSSDEEAYEEPTLNLTPLIDVVFVVLITFMLIAPILNIDLVDLATGGPTSKKASSHSSLAITLKADSTIWYQGKRVTLSELETLLKKNQKPGQIPQLATDKMAPFGAYQSIKNMLEAAGFEQMDVLLKPE